MGSLKNGHVFANMLSFPRLGLMGAMPSKPLEVSLLGSSSSWGGGGIAAAAVVAGEKVFALVVFGEKNAAFVLVPARLHTYVVLFWVGEEAARHHLHEQACFLHSTPKPACSNPSGTASLPPPPLGSRTSLGGGG